MRPGLPGSWEELFHQIELRLFLLKFREHPVLPAELAGERLERAIGVIYRPETERISHLSIANNASVENVLTLQGVHIGDVNRLRAGF